LRRIYIWATFGCFGLLLTHNLHQDNILTLVYRTSTLQTHKHVETIKRLKRYSKAQPLVGQSSSTSADEIEGARIFFQNVTLGGKFGLDPIVQQCFLEPGKHISLYTMRILYYQSKQLQTGNRRFSTCPVRYVVVYMSTRRRNTRNSSLFLLRSLHSGTYGLFH
jgi:hypothetical protein